MGVGRRSREVVVHKGRHLHAAVHVSRGAGAARPGFAELPDSAACTTRCSCFQRADARAACARASIRGPGRRGIALLADDADRGTGERREIFAMIAQTFGALMAMAFAALLIWFVLKDQLFILYAALFSLRALYVVYLSGQGFSGRCSRTKPLGSYAWVPAALGGATLVCSYGISRISDVSTHACTPSSDGSRLPSWCSRLRIRHIIGLSRLVAAAGGLIFVGSAVFTLRHRVHGLAARQSAAGWFLVAWGLLEATTIATAVRLCSPSPGLGRCCTTACPCRWWRPPFSSRSAWPTACAVTSRVVERRTARTDGRADRCAEPSLDRPASRRGVLARPRARLPMHSCSSIWITSGDQRYLRPLRR